MVGIKLDSGGDLLITNGRMALGDTMMQEVAIILQMNQGEQKLEPLLGANLTQFIKGKAKSFEIEKRVKMHLAMDRKDYNQVKKNIKVSKW